MSNLRATAVQVLAQEANRNEDMRRIIRTELYKKDLFKFIEDAWDIIEPGVPYSHNWHIEYLAEEVLKQFPYVMKKVYKDAPWEEIEKEITRRVIINVPTRSMKTLLISVFIPVWLVIHDPTLKVITVSYSEDLAVDINNKRRQILSSEWFVEHFSDIVTVAKGSDRQDRVEFDQKGILFATSIGGTFTGMGGDLIILDDPQKPGAMGSQAERQKAVKFFEETLPTRINDRSKGVIINIQQRIHYEDLTGYILEDKPVYKLVKIPLVAEEDLTYVGPLTLREFPTYEGESFWPERMPYDAIETLRSELGVRNFSAQQQQDPTPDGGMVLDADWFRFYHVPPKQLMEEIKAKEPERYSKMKVVLSWDMNYTVNVKNDSDYIGFSAGIYCPDRDTTYVVDGWKKRLRFTETIAQVMKEREKYEYLELPITILIEKKANGGPILEVLDEKVAGILPFEPGARDKVARMEAASPTVESGHVEFPSNSLNYKWSQEMVADLVKFPFIKYDDLADSFSQMIIHNHVQNRAGKKTFKVHLF